MTTVDPTTDPAGPAITPDPPEPEGDVPEPSTVPVAAKAGAWRRRLDSLSPSAMIALGCLGLAVVGWLGLEVADRMAGPPAPPPTDLSTALAIVQAAQAQGQAPPATAAPARPVNPLEMEGMPNVTGEARRIIGSAAEEGRGDLLYLPTSLNLWRQMAPPFAPPGMDWCAWRLFVGSSGKAEVTQDEGVGVYLFDQNVPPCGGYTEGPEGTLPTAGAVGASTTSSTLGAASGPSR